MKFTIITLFPTEFRQFFLKGLIGKAFEKNCFELELIDLRNFALTKHRQVDDYPYAHQKGMLLKVDVVAAALRSIPNLENATILYTCPKGKLLHHSAIDTWATQSQHLVIICGYYEGIDERIFELFPITRVSLGDFVLSSGEIPALAIMDSVVRRLPGVLGNPGCIDDESIISHVLEAPQYTRPQSFEGKVVPDILQSGNHQGVATWERTQALRQTLFKKPHLLSEKVLSDRDQAIIVDLLKNQAGGPT